MKHSLPAAVVIAAALAGVAFAGMPDPAFRCSPAAATWQMRCECTSYPWGAKREPTFEVYDDDGNNLDIDTGLVVYLSRGRRAVGFSVVMKLWMPGRMHIVTHRFDAGRRPV